MNKEIRKAQTEGIVFKKAKETPSEEKEIRYSDFLRGTHGSASAKKKAEYKFKRATRSTQKKKKI